MMARLGALATDHARRTLLLAGLVFLSAGALGVPLAGQLKAHSTDFQDPASQSSRATALIEHATGQPAGMGLVALVQGADVRTSQAMQRKVTRVARMVAARPGFVRGLDFTTTRSPLLASRDGRETLVLASFRTQELARAAAATLRPILAKHRVTFGGRDVAFGQISRQVSTDLERAELLALPILLLLSFWVFRGMVAALLPTLVGGLSIVTTFLVLRAIDQAAGLSIFALNLVSGMGLGLAIDYSLFIVSRYREERHALGSTSAAIMRTLETAGRTVLYSSLTVAAAMASMLVFPQRFLYSMGFGGMVVAVVAGAVSLLVLPAVLVALGPRINSGAPARLQRSRERAEEAAESGGWYRLANGVMRRPGLVAAASAALLLVAAAPALHLKLVPADTRVLPPNAEVHRVSDRIARDFPVDASQAIEIVAQAGPGSEAQVAALGTRLPHGAKAAAPRYLGRDTWELDAYPSGQALSDANQSAIKTLRATPARIPFDVGGWTASFVDQKNSIADHLPAALAILAVTTLGILFLMTGSVVLPVKAFVMNLLTVTVGAGLLVEIFQHGHLSSALGFTPIGGLEQSNLVLLFTMAFALSTDYGVFLFGRIKEAHDSGLATRRAVALGLERTGRLVTAAALLFCVAIGAFATSDILFVKQLGVGTALAVAVDASIVRALLVPSLMGLLGDLNWWAPRPLRRIHNRIGLSEAGAAGA